MGVPAAHGHWGDGGADIRGAVESPEHDSVCLWGVAASIGRPAHFVPVRKYAKVGSREFRSSRKSKDLTQRAQRKGGGKSETATT